ncbi:MAG: PAS domain-containing sensor histidine kinase [Reichenbachiella sp.]|uniref:PAS domain-containing sensor histidine kinase n=1 Tax=Reichenbachiella sp. TaxID=2184521 RepID=UPI003266BBFC
MDIIKSQATLESESVFNALFYYATIGIVAVNRNGEIEMINKNGAELFGYDQVDLIGKKVETLIRASEPGFEIHPHVQHLDKPDIRPIGAELDLCAIRKDGLELPIEISLGNFVVQGETLAVAFICDISIRKVFEKQKEEYQEGLKKAEEHAKELEKAYKHEQELNNLKSVFVSLASHEFRTPLSTIMSSADLLAKYDREKFAERKDKHIGRIKSSVKNLVNILDDFLSLDRLEQGKIEPVLEDFNLVEIINTLIDNFQPILKKGQSIRMGSCEDTMIYSDQKMVKNIITNLISNASKYSLENDPIDINCVVDKDQIVVSVRDHGIGIPEEDQVGLFGSFFRASNVGNIQGTGLGLNIIKRYIELLGGRITFSSHLGEGTKFSVYLPRKAQ